MDGVLVHENDAIPGASELLAGWERDGIPYLVLTNNSIFTARDLSARLRASGLHVPEERIVSAIREVFDLRPAAIIDALDLRRPVYAATAAFGHFGRELPDFTWERTDRADALKAAATA